MDNLNLKGSQTGDVKAGDIAGHDINQVVTHIYNVTTSLEQVTTMLREDMQTVENRLSTLELVERQHANERQAMTRLITMLATESRTVSDVQKLLKTQIVSEADERAQRRRYLDTMLTSLIILAGINLAMHIYRVLRPSGRRA